MSLFVSVLVLAIVLVSLWFFYGLYMFVGDLVKEMGKTLGSLAHALEIVMKDLQERVASLEQLSEFTEMERERRLHN